MKKHYIKIVVIFTLLVFSSASFEENARPSMADHLHLSRSKDPVDGGWLPNLTGLPDQATIDALTSQISDIMSKEEEDRCTAIDPRLRMLVFQHFVIHQHMANIQDIHFDEKIAHQWAHVLAMILKESSGDSTNITDMSGRSISTNKPQTDLDHWKKILSLSVQDRIKLNYQTNFGLSQTSSDRLFNAFHLAQDQNFNTEFLEGVDGASTPRKIDLNTAIAIRRLIWFYQDFAQGRILQSDTRIHQRDIAKPEFNNRYKNGLRMALLYCGTRFMFKHKHNSVEYEHASPQLENAMATIAYCKLGNAQSGYGKNVIDEKCFAEWVTLCPALNVDIAILTPLSYFQTRGEKPVCKNTFKRLLDLKPAHDEQKPGLVILPKLYF